MNSILIVDDEKDNLEALKRLLRNQFEVTTATSPFEALKLIQKNEYAVIVSDQRMPEMTGVELLEKAKSVSPVATRVLLTGYTDVESVIGAINRGNIYRYIAKPWDPDDLRLTLRQAEEAYSLRKELEKTNSELNVSNKDLKTALEELKTLEKAKGRFLSLVSHELNTPLTVLSAFGTLLTEHRASLSPDLQKAVQAVNGATSRLSEIVTEVLTFVRLDAGSSFHISQVDLEMLVKEVEKGLKPALEKRKLRFSLQIERKEKVSCDANKMIAALNRLVEDGIRRAPEGSEIKVKLFSEGNRACLSLWRKGEVMGANVFSPFEPTGLEKHHQKDMGLGLATLKLIIEGHGGEILLQSDATKGTTITLSLPPPVSASS